jgi:hypothetical protein
MSELEGTGAIIRYVPTVQVAGNRPRTLWLTPEMHVLCRPAGAHPDPRVTDGPLVWFQNVLNAFVLRGPDMVKDVDLKQLDPPENEVWEFRSYAVKPYLRLFGSFVLPSHFLGVNFRVRDDLEESRGSRWNSALAETIERRNLLMPNPPYQGSRFSEYLR